MENANIDIKRQTLCESMEDNHKPWLTAEEQVECLKRKV